MGPQHHRETVRGRHAQPADQAQVPGSPPLNAHLCYSSKDRRYFVTPLLKYSHLTLPLLNKQIPFKIYTATNSKIEQMNVIYIPKAAYKIV